MMFSKLPEWLAAAAVIPAAMGYSLSNEIEKDGVQPELSLDILTIHHSPPHPVQFRLPPTFSATINTKWVPTPSYWFAGTWYFTYSNQPVYQSWRNMQWTTYPTGTNIFDNTLNDLTTFQVRNLSNPTVYQIYGIDDPILVGGEPVRDAFNYRPTGLISQENNTWQIIGWGYDEEKVPWAVLYEDPSLHTVNGSFDVVSRSDKGPAGETMRLITKAVKELGNAELVGLMAGSKLLLQDGGRNGEGWPKCNESCVANDYAVFPM